MTSDRSDSLFSVEAALRARLGKPEADAALVRRVVASARRRFKTFDRVRRDYVVDASERGITSIRAARRGEHDGAAAARHAAQGLEELHEYLDGRRAFFSVAVDLESLPAFQRRVLDEACRIPFGGTVSYSDLAERIDHPKAARAVGTALGRNPVPFIVPCHRVLRGDRSLGGYGLGLPMKAELLELERIVPLLEGCTTTRILCRVGCPALARARDDRKVVFASIADAHDVGYRPCRVCHPEAA